MAVPKHQACRVATAIAVIFLLISSAPAFATVMVKIDLDGLVGRADGILVGNVEKVASHWSEDKRYIVTDVTVEVTQSVHGVADKHLVIRRLGGSVDGVGMRVSGSPMFSPGEQVLLFTEKRGNHRWIVGMSQGVYRITRDASGRRFVNRRLNGLTFAKKSERRGVKLMAATRSSDNNGESLDTFIERIRETVKGCAAKKGQCRPPQR